MNRKLLMTTAAALFYGSMAFAVTVDEVVQDFQAQGYSNIEVTESATQIKVEASNGPGSDKVEVVIDAATGDVISTETYPGQGGDVHDGVTVGQGGGDNNDNDSDDGNDDEGDNDDGDDDSSDDGDSDDGGNDDGGNDDGGNDDGGNDDGDDGDSDED